MADLLDLSDHEFARQWPQLTAEERREIPADIQRQCTERFRALTPYVGATIASLERINGSSRPEAKPREEDEQQPAGIWPQPLDLEVLAEREPEPPRFIVPGWLPCGYATLLAGHGGVGKSGIALHLAVCIAAGVPFFGIEVERRRSSYLSCEDREGLLHWRLARICRHIGVDLANLRGWLDVRDLVGHDCVLWERDPRTGYTVTSAYASLVHSIEDQGTEFLVVDGVSDTFGGNENAKTEVKRYVNALVAPIPADRGAALLVGHIAKPAASGVPTTEGYSGTTGWHNSVRARWYLFPETRKGEDGERPERTGDLILELQKSNMGRMDQQMRFAWDEAAHLFVGREIVAATASDRAARDRFERAGIPRSLLACPEPVPAASTGQRTAFHVLAAQPAFPDSLRSGSAGRRQFWRHLEVLRAMGAVKEDTYRRADRHYVRALVATTEGARACGK
jgi:AAA domain